MTYKVFGGTLNLALSISIQWLQLVSGMVCHNALHLHRHCPSDTVEMHLVRHCFTWLLYLPSLFVTSDTITVFCYYHSALGVIVGSELGSRCWFLLSVSQVCRWGRSPLACSVTSVICLTNMTRMTAQYRRHPLVQCLRTTRSHHTHQVGLTATYVKVT